MKYYDIDENLARRAHEMTSMTDYIGGTATAEYRASVNAATAIAENQKTKVSKYYHDKIDTLLDKYSRDLAAWTNNHNRNGASCPSVMVSGPANYPIKKHEKYVSREDTLWTEYKEIQKILDKIKSVGTGPVDLADPHAREILTDQLEKATFNLDKAKKLNAWYKKHGSFAGFPSMTENEIVAASASFDDLRRVCPYIDKPYPDYELASLRGKIKRIQARLGELDSLDSLKDSSDDSIAFDGGEIVKNAGLNRLQIIFDDVPPVEVRDRLKGEAFRWSPKNQAWQRQLTDNAIRAAKRALNIA